MSIESPNPVFRQAPDHDEAVIRWLKRIFWIALTMAVFSIGSSAYTFQSRTTEAQRLDLLERKYREVDDFMTAQRRFNLNQANDIRKIAEGE